MTTDFRSLVRSLAACRQSLAIIASRPTCWPWQPGTIPKQTKRIKMRKVAKDIDVLQEKIEEYLDTNSEAT